MPRAIIITTHPQDFRSVAERLRDRGEEEHPEGTIYELGFFDIEESVHWEVFICETSETNASVALETERAIAHFKPKVIFLIATATGIKDVNPGDVVVASKIYGYESGKLPIGSVAQLFHCDLLRTWGTLCSEGDSPFIHAWSDRNESFEAALTNLRQGGIVVIDPIALFTIHFLAVADCVASNIETIGIAQTTINLLQESIEQLQGWESHGFLTFGAENGSGVTQEVTPEAVNAYRTKLEQMLSWVRDKCIVLPCYKALDLDRDRCQELNQVFIDPRDALILELLKIFAQSYRPLAFIPIFKSAVRQKFNLMPLEAVKIIKLVEVWYQNTIAF